jgi:hypothetical protein
VPLNPPRYPANLYSKRPTAPSLESLLALIAAASSAAELDEALRCARRHYAGSMMEQMERAGAQRADYLLNSMEGEGGDA